MDGLDGVVDDHLNPPLRLFERLRQIPGYTWDELRKPVHSSYDNWHVFGAKNKDAASNQGATTLSANTKSGGSSPAPISQSSGSVDKTASNNDYDSETSSVSNDDELGGPQINVVAKISSHALRDERAYYICKSLSRSADPHGNHIARPLELLRLSSQQGDSGPIVVSIFEAPGENALARYINFGPAWYRGRNLGDHRTAIDFEPFTPTEPISLPQFLDFAIGATECLEILHNVGSRVVHGEIRGDAFHFNEETGQVRLINFGSGLRSFEHGLTSSGWSTLSKEAGAKTKLSFISPEQTGRMPAEPDSRTDIYSLGILFWTLLTQQPAFDGQSPMDIIQSVLGRRLPSVSSIRMDVPEVIGRIVAKMTAKVIGERYHSASGLRNDLVEVQRLLEDGDSEALKSWKIATKDVSSFFILPTIMIGREDLHDEIVKIIDKVARRHVMSQKQSPNSLSSGSSYSDSFVPIAERDTESDNTSSADGRRNSIAVSNISPKGSHASQTASTVNSLHESHDSQWSVYSTTSGSLKPWEKNTSLLESRNSVDSSSMVGSSTVSEGIKSTSDGVGSLNSKINSQKFRRKGRCEVISIAGSAGLGKSCLVRSVQVEARRRGYFASSKFDQTKRTPFGPVLKLLSSLFKQVFSESDTNTPFHQVLKQYAKPAWPMLHKVLGLPEFLLGTDNTQPKRQASQFGGYNKSIRADMGSPSGPIRRESLSSRGSMYSMALGSQSSQDFLRAGSATKSLRLMNTFLDVLRVFAQHKFLCLCLDDLQFADEESLELVTQLISSRLKLVFILTYRPNEILPERIRAIIEPDDAEGIIHLKNGGVGVTRIVLKPLSEENIIQYVAETLSRSEDEVIPLSAVVQSKSIGNPFLMREMLDACHRKGCIYYDYRCSRWEFDLDRIFRQFTTSDYHDVLNNDFVTRRLDELPPASRSILAWASLIGTSFSFDLILRLMSGEFDFDDADKDQNAPKETDSVTPMPVLVHSQEDAVAGLQAAIQAYIIIATENDDKFRFAHDRYIQAASSLKERNTEKMNFIIARTLIKYYSSDEGSRDSVASHICESVGLINKKVLHRQSFRKILFESAQAAAESGARPTAAKYYSNCFALLQDDPWNEGHEDVYYDETLSLYIRAAECCHYMTEYDQALSLLWTVFENAKTAVDKAPAWVLQSRVYAQRGESKDAFKALKTCLSDLKIALDPNPTFEKCDAEFERLTLKFQSTDQQTMINSKMAPGSNLAAAGAVLVEIVSAAFWSDRLTFFQMTLVMVDVHMTQGGYPQSPMAFLHLGAIAISRFGMISFGSQVGTFALDLMAKWRDPYTLGRGGTIYSLFIGHVQSPLSVSLSQLEGALEYTIQAGDRISTILNFGIVALLKFFGSEHLIELESFCQYGCEEVPNWQYDCRGGTMLIAVRQLCRSLQGKTVTSSPEEVMSDQEHNTALYLAWIKSSLKTGSNRPVLVYQSLEIVPLFLYGHYQKAVEVGRACFENADSVWSARNTRFAMLFHGLAVAGLVWRKAHDPRFADIKRQQSDFANDQQRRNHTGDNRDLQHDIDEAVKELQILRKKIVDWEVVNEVNYLSWSKILDAQISELQQLFGLTLQFYEESLDHAVVNGFIFEEALGTYLLAGFLLRRGARRPAKSSLRETIMLYRQFGAVGVATFIEEEHSLLLQGPTKNLRTADCSTQTDFAGDSAAVQYQNLDGDNDRQQTRAIITETKGERIDAWQGGSARPDPGSGVVTLDMLDLTSILESSQVISSVLQVNQLLRTMCEIILQNCGGLASLAAIIVEEDDPVGWSIAASGDPENGAEAHVPGLPLTETPMVVESVILYCTRFRETVFLPDLIHDERFSNVDDLWWAKNPLGKSVIAIPIAHGTKPLLGVLYLEGQPNAFTDRNLTVLQLLVNQIGISYSNALTLKAIEKVSASNISMVESQKRALSKAKDAEAKSRLAEAEANRNVKLAEEAAKAKSIFLANVSHELRTPLNGVIGNSELLKDSELSKEQAEMADSIRVSADLLLTVINDILDFSKMEADKMKLFIVAFNADEMLREVVRSVSYSNRDKRSAKDVEIKQDINLPDTLIYGDPVRLHQVIGNLIGNSLKFTEQGSITVGARQDASTATEVQLTFWVRDTGIGISKPQLAKLFKPFSQADASTARKYGGSGLGLSICKSLVEAMMNGKIELNSEVGVGTTVWFTVTFPKANPEASAGDSQAGSEERDHLANHAEEGHHQPVTAYTDISHVPRGEVRICIAEDNPINQKIAIQFVQKLGFTHVDAYDNGLAAVEGLRKMAKEGKPYHLVLMDVQMPVLDGYEATELLRRDPIEAVRGVLVIAMTASAIQGDREKCLASGMTDYLAKPVRVHILKKKLEQYLQQRPLPMPNLQTEANRVAHEVLMSANSIAPLPIAPLLGNSRPSDTRQKSSTSKTPQLNSTSSRPLFPPRASSRNKISEPNAADRPAASLESSEINTDATRAGIRTINTNIPNSSGYNEELSPRSLPQRNPSVRVDEIFSLPARRGRHETDEPEFNPVPNEDSRSESTVRIATISTIEKRNMEDVKHGNNP